MTTHTHEERPHAVDRTSDIRKRLFVFCDGTWQDGINNKSPLTNVATLARWLEPIDSDGCPQIVYYDGGVGNVTSTPAQLIDGATGRGISAKIRNAYSFLAHNYNFDKHDDEIILVGFSRGAFAVQCLASLISQTGLLEKQYLYYLRDLFILWAYQEVRGGSEQLRDKVQILIKSTVLHKVKITACAVWETVSALGIPTQLPPRPLAFVGKKVPNRVDHAFQALALDENRPKFKPCVWECKEPEEKKTSGETGEQNAGVEPAGQNASIEPGEHNPSVSQVWFLGSHGDVGGNGDAALGAVTLLWMIGKLHDRVGVSFNEAEIAKHLKHKYLEWDFAVNKISQSFKETRILSTMPHSGRATKSAWYWLFIGRKARTDYLMSIASNKPLGVSMEIHFTVRVEMASGTKCSTLQSWKTVRNSSKVQWQSGDRRQTLDEHDLGKMMDEDKEHDLLWKWCNDDEFLPGGTETERTKFVKMQQFIEDPKSTDGLRTFANFLGGFLKFEEDDLARTAMYPTPSTG